MPGGYSKKELEDTSMESYESWRSARPHPPSNAFGDALPPRPAQGGGEEDEVAQYFSWWGVEGWQVRFLLCMI